VRSFNEAAEMRNRLTTYYNEYDNASMRPRRWGRGNELMEPEATDEGAGFNEAAEMGVGQGGAAQVSQASM